MSINHIIFFCWCLCPLAIFSQTKYSNTFLDIGVGARSLAMGKSTVAQVDDVTAGYWNPAGLATMGKSFDVGLMHSEYFAG